MEIIADKGVNDVVADDTWDNIIAVFVSHIKAGEVTEGFLAAVSQAETILREPFPADAADKNELSNRLIEVGLPE